MRYAFFSDVHANIEALNAVLSDIDSVGVDRRLFLGDIVGYGPNPNECIERLLEVADLTLGGNHDWAMVDMTATDYFNPFAKEAMIWTIHALKDEHKEFLKRTVPVDHVDGFQVAHSSPLAPEEWRYILSYNEAEANYTSLNTDRCFIGHSHQPLIIEYGSRSDIKVLRETSYTLDPNKKYIVNIGSVGQPRDGDTRSCWVLYDSDAGTINYHRVEYDIEAVQAKMQEAELPQYLIDRLANGR